MKKLKATAKPNPYARKIVQTFKVNSEEMKTILARAHGFTDGNISEWLRYAAIHFCPKKEDFQK